MASKAELKGLITLNSAAFSSKLRRIQRSVRQWGAAMQRVGALAMKGTAIVAGGMAAAGAAVFKLTQATARAGDEFNKMALRTGISEQVLSEYAHAAQISGTEITSFQKGLKGVARFVDGAKDGLETYTRAMEKMGLTTADLENKTPQEALETFMDAIRDIKDPLLQSAMAQQVFGRAGQELMPLIKEGGDGLKKLREEAKWLGITFDKDAAAKSAKFNDSLTRLKGAMAGVRNKLVLAFITEFQSGIDKLIAKIVQFREQGKFTEWAATSAGAVNNFIESVRINIARIANYVPATFQRIKTAGMIAWDALVLGVESFVLGALKGFDNLKAGMSSAGVLITTAFEGVWNTLKRAGQIAFDALKVAGLAAFVGLTQAAETSINAIITAWNKLPKVNKINLVNFDSIDKALAEIDKLEAGMKQNAAALASGADVTAAADKGKAALEQIAAESKTTQAALDAVFQDRNGERMAALDANVKAFQDAKLYSDAIAKTEAETLEIQKQHAAVRDKITAAQNAAYEAERKRHAGEEETLETLKEQNEELKKGIPLRGIFQAMTAPGAGRRSEPNSAVNRQREGMASARERKLWEDQLKVQKKIAENTARMTPAMAW